MVYRPTYNWWGTTLQTRETNCAITWVLIFPLCIIFSKSSKGGLNYTGPKKVLLHVFLLVVVKVRSTLKWVGYTVIQLYNYIYIYSYMVYYVYNVYIYNYIYIYTHYTRSIGVMTSTWMSSSESSGLSSFSLSNSSALKCTILGYPDRSPWYPEAKK